jgi:two-component system nitrogen regulation response regulator GlnG
MGKMSLEGLAPTALEALIRYDWPGNVRQLQSVVRHGLLHTTGTVLSLECLPTIVVESRHTTEAGEPLAQRGNVSTRETDAILEPSGVDSSRAEEISRVGPDIGSFVDERLLAGSTDLYNETIEEVERYLFARMLSETHGNQSKAADILGITRGKVRDRIAYFGIQLERAVTIQS